MTNEVEITVFFDRTESTFRLVDELLKQYVHRNPRLKVTHVDPLQQPREARRVQACSVERAAAQRRGVCRQ